MSIVDGFLTEFEDPFSEEVWYNTYKHYTEDNVNQTFQRVSKAVAAAEKTEDLQKEWEAKFYDLLTDFKGTAGGRIYSNAGTGLQGTTMINCFVSPIPKYDRDSLEGIMEVVLKQAQTLKSEGGWGMNFSWIRPRGSYINGVGVETPGAVKYMEIFDKVSDVITAGSGLDKKNHKSKNKIRKGAMMGLINCVSGDTIIKTIQGDIPIKDLVGTTPIVYCRKSIGDITVTPGDIVYVKANKVWSNGIKKTIKIIFDNNKYLICTPEHKIYVYGKGYTEANSLQKFDKVVGSGRLPVSEMEYIRNNINVEFNIEENPSVNLNDMEYRRYYALDRYDNEAIISQVVSIEDWDEIEVFDMSVPEFHNFIANDIVVHNCSHPDVEEFISAKQSEGRLTKFNISVAVSDKFMDQLLLVEQLKKDGADEETIKQADKWDLIFPDTQHEKYKEIWDGDIAYWQSLGYPVVVYKTVSITGLWHLIMKSTYNRNDPGVIFMDRANHTHLWNYGGREANIQATNPCGEQCLPFGFSCNLFSLNLTQFINLEENNFDLEKLKKYVRIAIRFSDNINDVTLAPTKEYEYTIKTKRRIGLGIMGWGSALYLLRTRFASDEAEKLKYDLMKTLTHTAVKTSIELAKEKGMFEGCNPEILANHIFWDNIELDDETREDIRKYGMRNSALFSIQPTGNTGIMANIVSGGLEPIFMPEYIRTVIQNSVPDHIKSVTPKYWQGEFVETDMFKFVKEGTDTVLRGEDTKGVVYKIDKNRGLTREVACEDYGVRHLKKLGLWDPKADWAVSTEQLSVEEHVRDVTNWAVWIDSSLSKTINIPNSYPFEDFENIYFDAYKGGYIKGLTTYRAGTMTAVLSAKESVSEKDSVEKLSVSLAPKRPMRLPCDIHRSIVKTKDIGDTKEEKWMVFVGLMDGHPYEIFGGHSENIELSRRTEKGILVKRKCNESDTNRSCYDLQIGEDDPIVVKDVVSTFKNELYATHTRMISTMLRHGIPIKYIVEQLSRDKNTSMHSFFKVVARVLKKYVKDGEESSEKCPTCLSNLIFEEGCTKCMSCGFSKCG